MPASVHARPAARDTRGRATESSRLENQRRTGMTAEAEKALRIGLVGCGRISKNHFAAISAVDGLELTGVADTDVARARSAGETYGARCFASLDEMLKGEQLDI